MKRREFIRGLAGVALLPVAALLPRYATGGIVKGAPVVLTGCTGPVGYWPNLPNMVDFSDSAVLPPRSERALLVADGRAMWTDGAFKLIHPDGRVVDLYRQASLKPSTHPGYVTLKEMERRYERFGEAWWDWAMARNRRAR